jgi:hypothetical protein
LIESLVIAAKLPDYGNHSHQGADDGMTSSSAWREESKLIGELSTLNREVGLYVLHLLDVDAQRKPELPADQEHALGARLVTLGSAIQTRAAQRISPSPSLVIQGETTGTGPA